VEEIGRARPKTVSELMATANRFADGEDAYKYKRGRSPKVDDGWRVVDDDYGQAVGKLQAESMMSTAASLFPQ
jgi:hypothetical protein